MNANSDQLRHRTPTILPVRKLDASIFHTV